MSIRRRAEEWQLHSYSANGSASALVTVIAPGNSYIAITSYYELLQAFSNFEVLAICYNELVIARNSELVIAICYYLELLPGGNSELVIAIC